MVFIEGMRGNVLFTGDFRLPLHCASRLAFFKETSVSLANRELTLARKNVQKSPIKKSASTLSNSEFHTKQVDNLYIDMTFFKIEIKYIPTREESVQVLVKFIKEFISSNDPVNIGYHKNLVYMKTSARIGFVKRLYVFYKFFMK